MTLIIEPRKVRLPLPKGVAGPDGLIMAVLVQAIKDAIDPGRVAEPYQDEAALYFCSDTYKHHLGVLGLPGDWLPAGIERVK